MNNQAQKAIVWLVVGILAIGISQAQGAPKRYPRINFGEGTFGKPPVGQQPAFPAAPSEVRVYRVQKLDSKKDILLKLFKALPLPSNKETKGRVRNLESAPESLIQNEKPVRASIGGWNVGVWDGGQFTISNWQLSDRICSNEDGSTIPSPKEARKAADAFLNKLGPLPIDVQFSEVGPGQVISKEAGKSIVLLLNVYYTGTIDGLPVYGGVGVTVGAGPTVVAVNNRLRRIVPDGMVPILSAKEAFERLRSGEGSMSDESVWNAADKLTPVRLSYYLGSTAEDLAYIMPIYVFEGESAATAKRKLRWRAFLEAIRPEFLEAKAQ